MEFDELRALPLEIAGPLESGYRLWRSGQPEAARAQLHGALRSAEAGESVEGVLGARHLLGSVAYELGDMAAAWRHHTYVLERSRALGLKLGVASSLHNVGLVAAREDDLAAARLFLQAAIAAYESLGRPESAAAVRANLARIDGEGDD